MRLYHKDDVALEPIDDRCTLEKALNINEDFYIPSSSKGRVKMVNEETVKELGIGVGDEVYFDPRMMIEIKDLKLIIVDKKSILMRC